MPTKPPVGCDWPGCRGYAVPHSSYCAVHKEKARQEHNRYDRGRYERRRAIREHYDNPTWRFNLEPAMRIRDPYCKLMITEDCKRHEKPGIGGNPTEVIDHIIDHKGDPKLFFDPKNLQGACKACHDKKTGLARVGKDYRDPVPTGSEGKQFTSTIDAVALDKVGRQSAQRLRCGVELRRLRRRFRFRLQLLNFCRKIRRFHVLPAGS